MHCGKTGLSGPWNSTENGARKPPARLSPGPVTSANSTSMETADPSCGDVPVSLNRPFPSARKWSAVIASTDLASVMSLILLASTTPRRRLAAVGAGLAVVGGQPVLGRHLDHDLLVGLAARADHGHVPFAAFVAQVPDGHGELDHMTGRAGYRRGPGRGRVLIRPRLVLHAKAQPADLADHPHLPGRPSGYHRDRAARL